MHLEIKNINVFTIVEPWNCPYEAELFIDGKPAAYIQSGGSDDTLKVTPMAPTDFPTLMEADAFCKQKAGQKSAEGKQVGVDYRKSLNYTIESIMLDRLEEVNRKTFQMMKQLRSNYCIVYGQPDSKGFSTFKLPLSVANYVSTKEGQRLLVGILKTSVLPRLGPNDRILNENIPASLVQKAYPVSRPRKKPAAKKVVQSTGQRKKKR